MFKMGCWMSVSDGQSVVPPVACPLSHKLILALQLEPNLHHISVFFSTRSAFSSFGMVGDAEKWNILEKSEFCIV